MDMNFLDGLDLTSSEQLEHVTDLYLIGEEFRAGTVDKEEAIARLLLTFFKMMFRLPTAEERQQLFEMFLS